MNRPFLGLVLLRPMDGYKEVNFTFCGDTINEEYIYQTNGSHFTLNRMEKVIWKLTLIIKGSTKATLILLKITFLLLFQYRK